MNETTGRITGFSGLIMHIGSGEWWLTPARDHLDGEDLFDWFSIEVWVSHRKLTASEFTDAHKELYSRS